MLKAKLTKPEKRIIEMLFFDSGFRATRPIDLSTSFQLVDEKGENRYVEYWSRKYRMKRRREERRAVRINRAIWHKYIEWETKNNYNACAPLREFYLAYQKLRGKKPSTELLRIFVELVIKTEPVNQSTSQQLTFGWSQQLPLEDQQLVSTIQNGNIILYPKTRKEPSIRDM